ncbi:MAG: HU family DNA-binding protein [Pseudomonadota bacterium]
MSKKDLIDAIARDAEISKEKAGNAVDALITHVEETLKAGDEVRLPGFGSFKVTHRPERMGRNPQTGKQQKIKASNVPKFQASKNLKEALN